MATKEKTSAAKPRSAAKKKKTGLFGFGKKQTAKRPVQKAAQSARRRELTEEEQQRRREAAAARAQAEQRAAVAQQTAVAPEDIPEMVFKPTEETEEPRIRTPEENKRAAVRRRSAKRILERKEEAKRSERRPNVTYTDPVPFNLQKLLLQLAVVTAVVLAVVMGLSVFFKVGPIMVYGNHAYSATTVKEASGIEEGSNLLTFGSMRARAKILTALPYVETVRIGIKLPDTVNIYIKEYDVVYAIETNTDEWWLMTSGGKIVEKIDAGIANSYTKVEGVQIENPTVGSAAKAVETLISVPQETAAAGEAVSTEPVFTVTGSDKLKAALLILQALESNEIVGEAASINVQSLNSLELRYGVRYLVKLGDTSDMEYKISMMKAAVAQLNDYQTGILDVSFTTWTDRPGYTPYT